MWKCVPRNLRESVERRVTRKISRSEKPPGEDIKLTSVLQSRLIAPATQNVCNLQTPEGNVKDRLKTFGESNWELQQIKKVTAFQQERNNENCKIVSKIIPSLSQLFSNLEPNKRKKCGWRREEKEKQQGSKWETGSQIEHTWIGALGWSTALVLGWYLIQPLYRLWVFPCDKDRGRLAGIFRCRVRRHNVRYVSLVEALSKTALAQPILPTSQELLDGPVQVTNTTFGPPTAEEALNEAARSFLRVHNSCVGDVDNSLGMNSMKQGKHKEAVFFFTRGMEYNNPVATFNLAVCYEKGLGTSQDLKKAAKYYKLASDGGHATAMYNLGVFHVHGWGGLPVDHDRAHALFEKASTLGQNDAKQALDAVPEVTYDEATTALLKALGLLQLENLSTSVDAKDITHLIEDTIFKYKLTT